MQKPESVAVIIPTLNSEKSISDLIKSIYEQDYRPIVVIVVDGGSTDGTRDILENLAEQLGSPNFQVKVFMEENYGTLRSPANARNIGIAKSMSKFILFFDADYELTDRALISKVVKALDATPCVGVKVLPKIDTWLELNCAIDDAASHGLSGINVHKYCGYQRGVFEKATFDPALGFGEDRDLHKRLALEPIVIDAYCARHFVHTFEEWYRQSLWYGRTYVRYLLKHKAEGILVVGYRIGAFLSLASAAALALLSYWFSATLLGVFLGRLLYSYLKSKTRKPSRIVYLLARETLAAIWFITGMLMSAFRRGM